MKQNVTAGRPNKSIRSLTRRQWRNVADAFNSNKAEDAAKTMMELFNTMALLVYTSEQQEQSESAGYENAMHQDMERVRKRLCYIRHGLQLVLGQQQNTLRCSRQKANNFHGMAADQASRYRRDRMLVAHFVVELDKLKSNLNDKC